MEKEPNQHINLFKYKKHYNMPINERRMIFLEEQKEKRHQITDKNRELFDQLLNTLDEVGSDEMEWDFVQNTKKTFKFELMHSDWFTDIPDDLEENWFAKCAPAGFRVLVVCRKRFVVCYNTKGHIVCKRYRASSSVCESMSNGTTILDGIYNKETKAIFIFDCLCWNNMSMIDSEADFRFYWLKSKFAEDLEIFNWTNIKFVLVDYIPAQRSLIQDAMFGSLQINENNYYYDGIVFYHKNSHYTFGRTPLTGWLASYMLTEILHIDVPQEHLFKKPEDYQNVHDYIESLKTKKKRKINSSNVTMESS